MQTPSSVSEDVRLSRGASYLIVQNLGMTAIPAIGFLVLTRLISTTQMGEWTILTLVVAACQTFTTWFPQAVTKFVAENSSKGEKVSAASAYYQALRANFIIYILVSVLVYLNAPFLAFHLLGGLSDTPLFRALAFDLFLSAGIIPIVTAAMLGLQMFRETALVGLIFSGIFRQLAIISLIIVMRGLVGMVIGWIVSDGATAIIYVWLTARALGQPQFDFPLTKLFRYYFPLELGQIVTFAQSWFDRSLMVVFVPLSVLGVYNAALTAFGVLTSISTSMVNMLFPVYSRIQNVGRMRGVASRATRYANFILVPLAFGLLATARPAVTLMLGESYRGGILPLEIFCGAFAITAFTIALAPILWAWEKTKLAALMSGITVVISSGLAYALLPELGIIGASIARGVSMILLAILIVVALAKMKTLQLDLLAMAKTFVAGAVMAGVLLLVQMFEYSKFLLPLYASIGVVTYLIALRLLKATDQSDFDLLEGFLGIKFSFVSRFLGWILGKSDTRLALSSQTPDS